MKEIPLRNPMSYQKEQEREPPGAVLWVSSHWCPSAGAPCSTPAWPEPGSGDPQAALSLGADVEQAGLGLLPWLQFQPC